MKRILFPTDFSRAAESAFEQAAFLAERYGSELHILHVVVAEDEMAFDGTTDPLLAQSTPKEPFHLKDREEAAVPVAEITIVEQQVAHPSPARAILHYATLNRIDLVVMGTHGRTGMDRWLLGSVAEQVVRGAPCPVLTIRNSARQQSTPVSKILVPFDFSADAERALAHAVDLAHLYGARIDVLHVIEERPLPGIYGFERSVAVDGHLKTRVLEGLQESVQQALAETPHDIVVCVGVPAQEIIDYAHETQPDLIVIASHGLTGLRHLLLGSVTEKVVRYAPCWVLTVRGEALRLPARTPTATATTA